MFVKKLLHPHPLKLRLIGGLQRTEQTLACWLLVQMEVESGEWLPALTWPGSFLYHRTERFHNPWICMNGAPWWCFCGPPPPPQKKAQLCASGWVFECCKGESLRGWKYEGFFSILYGKEQGKKKLTSLGLCELRCLAARRDNKYFCSRLSAWLVPSAQRARPSLWWQNPKRAAV